MEIKRNSCKECPWKNKDNHSKSWIEYANKMTEIGQIESSMHSCHMITKDVWGFNSEISSNNVCIGSIESK